MASRGVYRIPVRLGPSFMARVAITMVDDEPCIAEVLVRPAPCTCGSGRRRRIVEYQTVPAVCAHDPDETCDCEPEQISIPVACSECGSREPCECVIERPCRCDFPERLNVSAVSPGGLTARQLRGLSVNHLKDRIDTALTNAGYHDGPARRDARQAKRRRGQAPKWSGHNELRDLERLKAVEDGQAAEQTLQEIADALFITRDALRSTMDKGRQVGYLTERKQGIKAPSHLTALGRERLNELLEERADS